MTGLKHTKVLFILATLAVAMSFSSCTTVKQSYHDITSRNNAYFNANEKLKLAKKNIEQTHEDDYDEILTLYPTRDLTASQNYANDLDDVIQRSSSAIRKHGKSPDDKGTKKDDGIESRWTDNGYYLIGQCYYLKGDFDQAIETFQYMATEYKEKERLEEEGLTRSKAKKGSSKKRKKAAAKKRKQAVKKKQKAKKKRKKAIKKKKKKKKKGKPTAPKQKKNEKNGKEGEARPGEEQEEEEGINESAFYNLFHHLPRRPEAMVWLVNSYTAQAKFKEAETVITLIDADRFFPDKRLYEDLRVATADHFIQREDYGQAIVPLEELTEKISRKNKKIRYNYILAQLYGRMGDNSTAIDKYKIVLKSKPAFEMAFNAKMSIARIAAEDGNSDYDEIKKLLVKLLKDDKNTEFFDQVYYALAELELRYGNKETGIDYLVQSTEASTTNTKQKARSFLKLANLYYDDQVYVTSQSYHDSTLAVLAADDVNYLSVSARNEVLKDLVANINTVALQDSMLQLAGLSESRLQLFLDDETRAIMRAEDDAKLAEEDKKRDAQNVTEAPITKNTLSTSSSNNAWYENNFGPQSYNTFIKEWGKRKLEDNWRRSDKSSFDFVEEEEEDEESTTVDSGEEIDRYDEIFNRLKKRIPQGEAGIASSNNMIQDALYTMATIYKNNLRNIPKAIESLEEMLRRYPDSKYLVETYYNLYLMHASVGNKPRSDYYRNLIMSDFGGSTFASIIRDPDFLEKSKKKDQRITDYYTSTYALFVQDSAIDVVFSRINAADSIFEKNHLKPQFALLEAFAIGKTKPIDDYIVALQGVTTAYAGDDVAIKAEEILEYLQTTEDTTLRMKVNAQKYDYDKQSIHFFMLAWNNNQIGTEDMKLRLAEFNDVNRSLERYNVQALNIIDSRNIVLVKEFDSMKKAASYLQAVKEDFYTFDDINPDDLEFFIISDTNFNMVIKNREFDSYRLFFEKKYRLGTNR